VGVDEIAREAGFTKRTLYYHFPTKDDLIAAWLDYTSALTAPPAALEEMAPEAAIMAMFGGLARTLSNGYRGCPFILTAAELVGASPQSLMLLVGTSRRVVHGLHTLSNATAFPVRGR